MCQECPRHFAHIAHEPPPLDTPQKRQCPPFAQEDPGAERGHTARGRQSPRWDVALAFLRLPSGLRGASDSGQEGPQVLPASPARLASDPGLDAGVGSGPGVVRVLEEVAVVGATPRT